MTGVVVQAGTVTGGVHIRMPGRDVVVPRQLPSAPRRFTGRERELDRIVSLVGTATGGGGAVVVSAINGMPGAGKTALVLHAARRLSERFPDGQFFLDLHGHTAGRRPVEAVDALGSLLVADGVSPRFLPVGLDDRAALWRSRVTGRRVLLVLDDAAGHAQVEPLLPGSDAGMVLITSRRRLSALDADSLELGILTGHEAAQMFLRLVPVARTDRAAVEELVDLSGRLPLAIVLLAGILNSRPQWTVRSLVSDISAATSRLARLKVDDRAVAAAFELSYRCLPGIGQRLFRRLGLHPGATVDPYAVAALEEVPVAEAAERLRVLYDDHLLDEPTQGYYRMHELLREYARDLAAAEPAQQRGRAVGRLLDYYQHTTAIACLAFSRNSRARAPVVARVPPTVPQLSDSGAALRWLRAERGNILACVDHAYACADDTRAVGLTAAAAPFLRYAGPWDVAVRCHENAVDAAQREGDRHGVAQALGDLGEIRSLTSDFSGAIEALRRALAIWRDLVVLGGEADALTGLGVVQEQTGEYGAAIDSYESALAIYRGIADRSGEANVHRGLGAVYLYIGDYPAGIRMHERALALYLELDDRLGEGNAHCALGNLGWLTGDYPGATTSLEQAIGIFQQEGDRNGLATALNNLGIVLHLSGSFDRAGRAQERALGLYRALGNRRGEGNALNELGIARWLNGDYGGARQALRQALGIHRAIHDRRGEANALHQLGAVHRLVGRYQDAITTLRRGLVVFREIHDRRGEANVLNEMANSLWIIGDYGQATELLTRAQAIQRDVGDQYGEANALQQVGTIRRLTGDAPGAGEALVRAVGLQRDVGDSRGEAATLRQLGALHMDARDYVAAAQALRRALQLHRRVGDRVGEAGTLHRIGSLHLARGRPDIASRCYRRGVALARDLKAPWEEATGLEGLGRVAEHLADVRSAATALNQALDIYHRIGTADATRLAAQTTTNPAWQRPERDTPPD
ncbi:tetratricopeptide repeat protein [Amycolatopsis samaneae]